MHRLFLQEEHKKYQSKSCQKSKLFQHCLLKIGHLIQLSSHYSIQLLKALPRLTMRLLSCSEWLSTLCLCCRWSLTGLWLQIWSFRKVIDWGISHSVVHSARWITIAIIYQTACKNPISSNRKPFYLSKSLINQLQQTEVGLRKLQAQ